MVFFVVFNEFGAGTQLSGAATIISLAVKPIGVKSTAVAGVDDYQYVLAGNGIYERPQRRIFLFFNFQQSISSDKLPNWSITFSKNNQSPPYSVHYQLIKQNIHANQPIHPTHFLSQVSIQAWYPLRY